MQFELSETHKTWQAKVHTFAQAELVPRAAQTDCEARLPMDVIAKMAPMGLLSMIVPEADGGAGLDYLSYILAIEEIGRACGSTALSLLAHNGLCLGPLVAWGSAEQKRTWLPRLTDGTCLGALALTEPGAGSDLLGGTLTTAVLDGDNWLINGEKMWITNPGLSPIVITNCRTDPNAGSRGFALIIVETDRGGVTVHPPERTMGLTASPTHRVTYQNVRVPKGNLLGENGRGLHYGLATLDRGRITVGAMAVGLAQAALDESLKYAKARESFGKPIGEHQAVQFMLADMATEIDAARLMVYRAAWLKDRDRPFAHEAAMAKLFASEVAERVAFKAIQIHGGLGYSARSPVERIYRDQRLLSIGEGTSEILRMVIGRGLLHPSS